MPSLLAQLASELGMDKDTLAAQLTAGDETLQPNYFIVNPDGSVAAAFPGGISIPEGSLNNNNFQIGRGIGFTRQHPVIAPSTSPYGGLIYEYEGGAGNPPFEDRFIMQAQADNTRSSEIILQSTTEPFGLDGTAYTRIGQRWRTSNNTGVFVSASPFGGGGANDHEYTILNALYQSHFAQILGSNPQLFRFSATSQGFAAAAGWGTYSFSWPITWTSIAGFVFAVQVSTGATIISQETFGASTTGFSININSAVAQNCVVMALGWGT